MTDNYLRAFRTSLPVAEGRPGRYLTRFRPLEMHNRPREHDMEATTGHAAKGMSLNLSLPQLMGYVALAGILSGTGLRGFRPFLVTAILFAEIELPRIIFRQRGIRPASYLRAGIFLEGLSLVLLHADKLGLAIMGLVAAVELVFLAAWWPFAFLPETSAKERLCIGLVLYLLAAFAVLRAWGWVMALRGG